MSKGLQVLVAGRSKQALDALAGLLHEHAEIGLTIRELTDGHFDPLHGVTVMPDVLILHLSPNWEDELKALSARPVSSRPPTLVVGSGTDVQLMRRAMRAGARDVLTDPVDQEELAAALQQIAQERVASVATGTSRLTAMINAKGGSGATLLTANVAHIMAALGQLRVAVLDMDIQFGALPLYLDLTPQQSIVQALNVADALDTVAFEAYMAKHHSGVHVLCAIPDQVVLPGEIPAEPVDQLLGLARQAYEHVIVHLPRQIDSLTTLVMERADQVVVVMEQGVTHVRHAARLISILNQELAVPASRILVVVNRYQAKSSVTIADIEQALKCKSPMLVPNDFKHVEEAINLGVPLYEHAKNAAITKALVVLAEKLSGKPAVRRKGFLGRAIPTLS